MLHKVPLLPRLHRPGDVLPNPSDDALGVHPQKHLRQTPDQDARPADASVAVDGDLSSVLEKVDDADDEAVEGGHVVWGMEVVDRIVHHRKAVLPVQLGEIHPVPQVLPVMGQTYHSVHAQALHLGNHTSSGVKDTERHGASKEAANNSCSNWNFLDFRTFPEFIMSFCGIWW